MTYQQIKQTIVDDKKLMDNKGLRKFILKWTLTVLAIALILIMPTFSLLGTRFAILVVVLSALLFTQMLSLITDEPEVFSKVNKFTSFWWIFYILLVLVYIVLKFFNIM